MVDQRGPLDQSRVDLLEACGAISRGEFIRRCVPIAGFERRDIAAPDQLIVERPTLVDHGIAAWVTTFRKGWLDRAQVPEGERAAIGAAVADHIGSNIADYVRLRFIMRKPV